MRQEKILETKHAKINFYFVENYISAKDKWLQTFIIIIIICGEDKIQVIVL